MQMTVGLAMPFDTIIAESLIGTEVGGLPGSRVIALQRVPQEGKPDAAVMVIELADELFCTYTDG